MREVRAPDSAIVRRLALVITPGTGNGTGNGTGKQGGGTRCKLSKADSISVTCNLTESREKEIEKYQISSSNGMK